VIFQLRLHSGDKLIYHLMLTTEAMISEIPDKDYHPAVPSGGMGM
jgi:hypothetical protein